MSRGEVQIFPFTVTSGVSTKIDLTPGGYDMMLIHSSSSRSTNMAIEAFVDEEQIQSTVLYIQIPGASAESGVVALKAITAATPLGFMVVPRGLGYTPLLLPYGVKIVYSDSGTYSGFLVCRRR
jgi:hypothetical protein